MKVDGQMCWPQVLYQRKAAGPQPNSSYRSDRTGPLPLVAQSGATQHDLQYTEQDGIVRKTIFVRGNPLAHLKIQPWLEEGTVHSAPAGYATENQGRNHIGYRFEDQPDASVTIEIEKRKN
jgi:hypothetical protein